MAGLLGGDTPQPNFVPLDAGTQGLLDQGVASASRPASDFANDLNKNVSENASGFMGNEQQSSQEAKRTGQDPGMFNALRNAYGSQAGTQIKQITNANQYKAQMMKADYLHQMAIAAVGQQQVATQNYSMLTDAYNQSEMARAGFVNTLFQTANTAMVMGAKKRPSTKTQPGGVQESPAAGRVGGYGGQPSFANYPMGDME